MIRTPLHNILPSLRIPIVSGPMGGAAGGKLAAEVSRAGGFGFIGGGYLTPSQLDQEFEVVESILGGPTGSSSRVEIGVGFLGWKLTQLDSSQTSTSGKFDFDPASRPKAFACIDATLKKLPRAIWLAFGTSNDLSHWAQAFRERERALHGNRTEDSWKLFVGVGSEQEAKVAVEEVGADVVVAQGIEAGGHGNGSSPPLSTLLPHIARRISSYRPLNPGTEPILLGAGGLSNGEHLVSCLALGASGAVYGTRFLLTPESCYPDDRKQVLLHAKEGSTVRSMAFDEARNTLDWPEGVDGRGIRNATVMDYEAGRDDKAARQATYLDAEKRGDADRLIVWAGTGVGNMNKIAPAGDVVRELEQEALQSMERVKAMSNENHVMTVLDKQII